MTRPHALSWFGDADQLVGRDRELATLNAVIADARNGRRGVVLVEGDAGMGKTALVRGALADESATTIWVSGDHAELTFDHGIIDQILRSAPAALVDGDDKPWMSEGDPVQSGAALVALVDGFELVPTHPLVVVVDDAQWADIASLRALTFAARRIRRDPVVLILTVRSDGFGHMPEGLLRLADDEGVRIAVAPLKRDEVRVLAERALGQTVTSSSATRLLEHTGGSPLHLMTLLEEISAEALLSADPLPVPRSFATLVLSRLARCDVTVEALVSAVAVLGGSADLTVAAAVAQLHDPATALDDAVDAGLLVPTGRDTPAAPLRVAVAHPLVQAAVLEDLPVSRRAELHRAASEVVDGALGVRHRLRSSVSPDGALWCEAMQGARHEAERGAHGTAATLLIESARIAPSNTAREHSVLDAVHQLLLAGRMTEAAARAPAVKAASPSARRSFALGRLAYTVGPRRETQAHLSEAWCSLVEMAGGEDCIASLGAAERSLAADVAALYAYSSIDRVAGPDAIRWSETALRLDPERAAQGSAGHALASGYAIEGDIRGGISALVSVCADSGGLSDPAVADAHCGLGLLQLWAHELDDAVVAFTRSLEAAERAASFVARETARGYLAETFYRQGRWDDAVRLAQISASLVDDGDQDWMAVLPNVVLARPLVARGEPVAGDHLERAAKVATAMSSPVGIGFSCISSVEAGACLRDHQRVVESAGLLVAADVPEGFGPWRASYVEALVAEGRLEEAAVAATDLEDQPFTPLQATDAARAAVVVAAARDDAAAIDEWAARGLAIDPQAVGPYPRARLELTLGRAWRRRGERRRASDMLDQARSGFLAVKAFPWLDQVEREIAALGLRPVRRSQNRGDELTPQEQAVAQLVATGLTNREVAAELVVSAKTVEHHLSRVYAKLGVRGRTELAHRLSSDGA